MTRREMANMESDSAHLLQNLDMALQKRRMINELMLRDAHKCVEFMRRHHHCATLEMRRHDHEACAHHISAAEVWGKLHEMVIGDAERNHFTAEIQQRIDRATRMSESMGVPAW